MIQSAVLHKLMVIGEAAARISSELKRRNSEIEWKSIVGFRNIVIHAYFAVKLDIIWNTVRSDVPQLKAQIENFLVEIDEK